MIQNTNVTKDAISLDKEAIEEYKKICFIELGIHVTDEEALEEGIKLIKFLKAVYGDRISLLFDKNKKKGVV